MSDYREKGIKVVDEMLDPAIGGWLKSLIGTGGFDGALAETAFDFAFGAAWARPGLTRAQRSTVVLGILIAQGTNTDEIRIHLATALKNGLTKEEVDEILIQAIPYAGFPAVAVAAGIWRDVRNAA
jgi:4-carboxymuconolactone decarboxylase